jgi:serine/threonine protein kinase
MSGSFTSSLSTPFETIEFGTMLDRGVSGEVHRGQWQGNDVAIKVFASGQLTDEAKESFRREVCIMNKLKHPNVVLLMAACPNPPRLAIVMEYVGGGSLYSHLYINKTVFTTEFTAQILANITRGLQYLHSINILHRDLKSKNVLLTGAPPHCQAKLCDFGLARMRLESATMTGNIGTIHWTAPEVLNCSRYHFSADIYSLGMVIYEMISGSIPFSKLLPPAVIVAVLLRRERPQPPLDTHCIFAALYNKCTTWEPADRPSILSILRDVQPLLSSHSPSEHTDTLNISWDDSLGDQTILGIDLDDDDDYELMQFLLGQSGSDEEDNAVGVELVDDDIKPKLMPTSSAERDIMAPDSIYEDTRGVLSSEELKTYHSYHRNLMLSSSINSSAHNPLHMNVPLIPANGIAPQRNNLQHSMSYEQEQQPRDEEEISFRDRANTVNEGILNTAYYDVDTEIATKLQREEKQQQIMNDYKLASDLQWNYRDNLVGTIAPAPPPPPLPTQLPLQHLPYRLTTQQLLLSQLKRPYLKRRLKPVKTIEKRAYRIGRVVDGTNSELSNFTLQKELAAFNKQWLQKVQLKEPKPPFPVGKVVIPERNFVRSIVHRMNSLVQSEIKDYNKMVLRPVDTQVKGKLPTVDDIEKEKNPPSPPPPPPPPPPPAGAVYVISKLIVDFNVSPFFPLSVKVGE